MDKIGFWKWLRLQFLEIKEWFSEHKLDFAIIGVILLIIIGSSLAVCSGLFAYLTFGLSIIASIIVEIGALTIMALGWCYFFYWASEGDC